MKQETFLVTLSVNSWDRELLDLETVDSVIRSRFQGTSITVGSVAKFNPDEHRPLSKLAAVKKVKSVLELNLRDTLHLVNEAADRGVMNWKDVTIRYKSTDDDGQYDFFVTQES